MVSGWGKQSLEKACEYLPRCAEFKGIQLDELDDLNKCNSGGEGCYLQAIYSSDFPVPIGLGSLSW